jgi:hypothetical protein
MTIELPKDIGERRKAYALERSLGISPAEACRRAGGKVENGQATKWERNRNVQAWIVYYRSLGQTEEMLAAKRVRIETALSAIAYGDGDDFQHKGAMPELDWPHRLNALGQLRDMHGFKAVQKTALTDPTGKRSVFDDWSKYTDRELAVISGIMEEAEKRLG